MMKCSEYVINMDQEQESTHLCILNVFVFADALRRLKWNSPQTTMNSAELIPKTPFLLLMFIHLVRTHSTLF